MIKANERMLDPISVKSRFNITEDDLDRLRAFRPMAYKHIDDFIEDFYRWLPTLPEFRHFFSDSSLVPRVKSQQKDYWKLFFTGQIDQSFFNNRLTVGKAHARIDLPVNSFCSAMNFSILWWLTRIPSWIPGEEGSEICTAFMKLALLDLTVVTESYADLTNDKIRDLLAQTNGILEKTTRVAEAMAKGDFSQTYEASGSADERVSAAINQMLENFKGVVRQAKTIAQGDYRAQVTPLGEKDELGTALFQMTNMLRDMSAKTEQEAWIKNGQAGLANLMRGDLTLHELSKNVISYLAKYLGALVGAFYCVSPNERDLLYLTGSFAHQYRKGNRNEIRFGEGLVGQCAIEKESIIFSDVPEDYVSINSSLGSSVPHSIIVVPLLFENEVFGVIELGSSKPISEKALSLLNQVNESIAISIRSAQDSGRIKLLLEESKKQASELQAQQEELKVINEELEKQQSSLQKSNEELEYQTKRLKDSEENIRLKNEALERSTSRLEQQKRDLEATTQQVELARRELEAKAKELELASKYKSEFLANMSHELRTPLNSLLILSESLANNEENNLTDEQVESAKIIHSGGKDLLNLINDILDLSKVEAGKLQVDIELIEVKSILDNLRRQFEPIAKKKSLAYHIEFAENAPETIRTDRKRIEQILKNFLSNAFKFTTEGSVTLRVHPPANNVRFNRKSLDQNNCVGISVIDTGIGIPKDKQTVIFEAFQQVDGSTNRKYGGTGLGLSISKELAKLLSCEIQLQSEHGKGSAFTLYVPQSDLRAASSDDKGSSTSQGADLAGSQSPKSVEWIHKEQREEPKALVADDRDKVSVGDKSLLIIEDDADFAQVLTVHARKRGYLCITALTAQEGLLCAQKYRPQAITLDMNLPDLPGERVLEQLKFSLDIRHIPVHIVSSNERSFFTLQKGAVGHLTKPIDADELNKLFMRLDRANDAGPKKVLVVEDDALSQIAIQKCIQNDNLEISSCNNGKLAFELLKANNYDCVILDLNLPDMSGFEILQRISQHQNGELPPIIIYTGKDLTNDEQNELQRYASSIVVKGVKSSERLIDELHLFLHSVDSMLPSEQRSIVRMFHEPGELLKGRKVLLVDDDMRNTYALSAALRKRGLKVVMADNGEMALQKLESDHDIDLVVMDIMMPVMDGYEAITRIRQISKHAHLPIIALTAKVMPEDKAKALACGANDFLTKPVDVQQLANLMQILLFRAAEMAPSMELRV